MLERFISFTLMPLFLVQGWKVRKFLPQLPEPQGLRTGLCGKGEQLKLLLLGDSAAAGVGVSHQRKALLGHLIDNLKHHRRVDWQLQARSGATTSDTITSVDKMAKQPMDVIVTSLGVNDVTSGMSAQHWLDQQLTLRDKIIDKFDPKLLVLSSLPPMGKIPALPQPLRWYVGEKATEFDSLLKQSCNGDKDVVQHLPVKIGEIEKMVSHDGFHPSELLYQSWAKQAATLIRQRV